MANRKRIRHPVQPVEWDGRGVLRFKRNPIVCYLLDKGGLDLNALHRAETGATRHDWDQFNQLIGYSVSGCPIGSRVTRSIAEEKAADYLAAFPADELTEPVCAPPPPPMPRPGVPGAKRGGW